MNNELKNALHCLWDIQDANGLNRKKQLLSYHSNNNTLKDILYFVFNPYIRTGIGWTKLNKMSLDNDEMKNLCDINYTIQGQFTYLAHNNTGRDKDVARVKAFILTNSKDQPKFEELLSHIFCKTLKLGISTTTIHKIWPGLIPGFGVQLAEKWQNHISELEGQEIFLTEKLDGNRCFAQVNGGQVTFYSRSGREIEGLDDIKNQLSALADGWYDGELLAKSFNETQSIVRTKGKKKDLVFNVFDYLTPREVEHQSGVFSYIERRQSLSDIFGGSKFENLRVVPLIAKCTFNYEFILETLEDYVSNGSEGLMINLNAPYQFGRTNQLLKVKNMYTLDLKIIGMREGNGEFSNMCGALIVDYKGYPVGVGSGLSKEDRIFFWNNRENMIDRVVEVQAFEECHDAQGNLSLRFPVFRSLRELGKEPSYE